MSAHHDRLLEAARSTALARELVERWRFEARPLAAAIEAKDEKEVAKIRAFREELLAESTLLTDRANSIYREVRG